MNKEYCQNTSFFYRRIYILFVEYCYNFLSIDFIKKLKIYENILDLKDLDSVDIIRNQIDILLKQPIDETKDLEKKIYEKEIFEKESKILEEKRKDDNFLKSIGRNKKNKSKRILNNSVLTVPNSEKRKKHYIDKKGSMKNKRRESANVPPIEIITTFNSSPKNCERKTILDKISLNK